VLRLLMWLWKRARRHSPKCTCVLSELVGIGGLDASRDSNCLVHGDAAMMNAGMCPDCRGTSFTFGPEGGVAQMVTCELCLSQFTVEVVDPDSDPVQIIYWGRVEA
jgi:hypothetical protein